MNNQQVGGTHYQTAYAHWDWVLKTKQGYLEGNATKYVSRWRKKGGVEDLKKALHYVNKLLEGDVAQHVLSQYVLNLEMVAFAAANDLTAQESDFCWAVMSWPNVGRDLLYQARDLVLALMEQADRESAPLWETEKAPHPVPVEDSNKHADRVEPYDVNPGGQNQPGGS